MYPSLQECQLTTIGIWVQMLEKWQGGHNEWGWKITEEKLLWPYNSNR